MGAFALRGAPEEEEWIWRGNKGSAMACSLRTWRTSRCWCLAGSGMCGSEGQGCEIWIWELLFRETKPQEWRRSSMAHVSRKEVKDRALGTQTCVR